jgi:hypothetical protein
MIWTKLDLYTKYSIIPLLIPMSRDFLDKLVVSELVKKFPTIAGTTNYAYQQNIIIPLMVLSRMSIKKQYFFLMSYFVLVLISTNRGCWLFIHFNILVLCLFFWYFIRSGIHDFLTYCIFLYFFLIVKSQCICVCGIYLNSIPISLDINFNTTHSNQCHSQGNSSLHVLRGFCECVVLVTHTTCAVQFILYFIALMIF